MFYNASTEGAIMLQRLQGLDGKRRLIELLLRQGIVAGDRGLAEALSEASELLEFEQGAVILQQDATDFDLLLLLVGSVSIVVNDRLIGVRESGTHLGEMALVDPAAKRSAAVIARELVVALRVSEETFFDVASKNPEMWKRIAIELARRLRQRNVFHRIPNPLPRIFIGCSTEMLPVGRVVADALAGETTVVRLWAEGVFRAGETSIESLLAEVDESDFAVLILGPDDVVSLRGEELFAPRDNVVFELGLFMGAIGRGRALLMRAGGTELRIPTDLLGLTPITYDATELELGIHSAAQEIQRIITAMGSR
jgi:CRP/FNR family cyclic AMP-dependent transcriptional regulator